MVPTIFKGNYIIGDVVIGRHCIIGSNSTILPNVILAEGASVGANSLVKQNLIAWTLYAGVPAKLLKKRDQKEILRLEKLYWESLDVR
jgi:galactoside O-acetyltransferase